MPSRSPKPPRAPLNASEPQEVVYCIPLWLRDEQIRQSIARVPGRIAPHYEKRSDPIAIVCYGPSLNETWEQIAAFPYRMTCSGAHRFLVERGVIPTHHVEVDPRAHKVALIGPPQPGVEYLIASACHAKLFDHLEGFDVKLWHVFDSAAEGIRTLPRGEWALTGGCGAGLRALVIARFLGFTDLHIFGMDGNQRPDVGKHAGAHPSQAKMHADVVYDGVTYQTTPAFLEAARATWHELDQMPDVRATFYGEGLVQHMARNYVPNPRGLRKDEIRAIGVNRPDVISASYRALNEQLHHENLAYGVGGSRHAGLVERLAKKIGAESVLDYGCGKGYLAKNLPFPIWEYDPAIPEKAQSPRPADLVVCTDVLEHVEPECLGYVLDDLRRCVQKVGYFVIHTKAAQKCLPDGRNTHLIQQGRAWWEKRLRKFFAIGQMFESDHELRVVVGPLPAAMEKTA